MAQEEVNEYMIKLKELITTLVMSQMQLRKDFYASYHTVERQRTRPNLKLPPTIWKPTRSSGLSDATKMVQTQVQIILSNKVSVSPWLSQMECLY